MSAELRKSQLEPTRLFAEGQAPVAAEHAEALPSASLRCAITSPMACAGRGRTRDGIQHREVMNGLQAAHGRHLDAGLGELPAVGLWLANCCFASV